MNKALMHDLFPGMISKTWEQLPERFQPEVIHVVKALVQGEGREGFSLQELWIYGSCARGEARDHSDLDLMALVSDSLSYYNPNILALKMIEESPALLACDILVVKKNLWETEQANICTFFPDIKQDRKLLYAQDVLIAHK